MDAELLEPREDLWHSELGGTTDAQTLVNGLPDWAYLQRETQLEHERMHGWVKVVVEDLQCDPEACRAFNQLMQRYVRPDPNGPLRPYGFMEASRILAHTLKDKTREDFEDLRGGPGEARGQDWSRYLQRACDEAMGPSMLATMSGT